MLLSRPAWSIVDALPLNEPSCRISFVGKRFEHRCKGADAARLSTILEPGMPYSVKHDQSLWGRSAKVVVSWGLEAPAVLFRHGTHDDESMEPISNIVRSFPLVPSHVCHPSS